MSQSNSKNRISRRTFLEGTGAALVVAAEAPGIKAQDGTASTAPHRMVRLVVNGKPASPLVRRINWRGPGARR